MTADRPWADLLNAAHIDAVLRATRTRLTTAEIVQASYGILPAYPEARRDAWLASFHTGRSDIWHSAWERAWDILAALYSEPLQLQIMEQAIAGTVRTLIAWDSAAELLDLPPDVLRTMADLSPHPVNSQATLLLPWAIVRSTEESKR